LPGVINGDNDPARRFSKLHVHAGSDPAITHQHDQIATVSVENRRYRLWRWLAWGLAAILAAVAVGQIVSALLLLSFGAWVVLLRMLPALPPALGAIVLIVAARRLRDSMFLQIGTSDGNRTVFHSQDRDQLLQVKTFLLHKINERDIAATYQFHFGDDIADDRTVDGPSMDGAGNQPIAGVRNAPRTATRATSPTSTTAPAAAGRADARVLCPPAQHATSREPPRRARDADAFRHSDHAGPRSHPRVATDLSNILHAYPSMVQFFITSRSLRRERPVEYPRQGRDRWCIRATLFAPPAHQPRCCPSLLRWQRAVEPNERSRPIDRTPPAGHARRPLPDLSRAGTGRRRA
jgi:hypothetical protein